MLLFNNDISYCWHTLISCHYAILTRNEPFLLQMDVSTEPNETVMNVTFPSMFPPWTQAEFSVPFDLFVRVSLVVNAILSPSVCVFGLFGNGLGLYVLWHDMKYQKQSIYRYMFSLMLFDNIYLIFGLLIGVTSIIQYYDFVLSNRLMTYLTFVAAYVDMVIYHTTSILLMVMALERLTALLRPLTVKQTWLYRFPRRIIVVILVTFAALAMPFPAGVEIFTYTFYNVTMLDMRSRPAFAVFHEKWSTVETVLSCIYPICMLVFNIAIPVAYCRYLYRRRLHLPDMSTNDTQQLRITMTVLWVTVLYMLLAMPKIFLQVIIFFVDSAYDHDGIHRLTFYFYTFIGDFFARINAANDFLLYVLFTERYRRILSVIFTRCWTKQEQYKSFSDIFRYATRNFSKTKSEKQTQGMQISAIEGSESIVTQHK